MYPCVRSLGFGTNGASLWLFRGDGDRDCCYYRTRYLGVAETVGLLEIRTFSEGQRAAIHVLMSCTELHSGVHQFDGLHTVEGDECPKRKESLCVLSLAPRGFWLYARVPVSI